jgi:hypothetical protein
MSEAASPTATARMHLLARRAKHALLRNLQWKSA